MPAGRQPGRGAAGAATQIGCPPHLLPCPPVQTVEQRETHIVEHGLLVGGCPSVVTGCHIDRSVVATVEIGEGRHGPIVRRWPGRGQQISGLDHQAGSPSGSPGARPEHRAPPPMSGEVGFVDLAVHADGTVPHLGDGEVRRRGEIGVRGGAIHTLLLFQEIQRVHDRPAHGDVQIAGLLRTVRVGEAGR